MANTLITPPETDSQTERRSATRAAFASPAATLHDVRFSVPNLGEPAELKSTNPFQSLLSNFRDAFFPEKLPPLVLESTPIAVADPMRVKRDPVSTGIAVGIHAVLLLLVIWISAKAIKTITAPQVEAKNVTFDVPPPPLPIKHITAPKSGGGGGGGDIAPASHGAPPKFSLQPQILAPQPPPKIPPKLAVEPTIVADPRLQIKNDLPNIGMINSPNVGVSLGAGKGNGIGPGTGNGYGPGVGGNIGGGVYKIGANGVSEPKLIYQVDPEFSEEARKAKFQGEVLVHLIVDSSGKPTQVKVSRPVGMGLDEKAKEAVTQYRFKPAMKDGKPVPVDMYVAVNFQIF